MADGEAATIKASSKLLLDVFGLEKVGPAQPCPCGSSDALSIYSRNGQWKFKCHSCGKQGSVIDALIIFKGMEEKAAWLECKERLGIANINGRAPHHQPIQYAAVEEEKPVNKEQPEINPLAERIVSSAHKYLMNSDECRERWMIGKRGISEEVAKRFRLGFFERSDNCGWVLPITNIDGRLIAGKMHFEIQPPPPPGEELKGKSRWMKKNFCLTDQSAVRIFWPHPFTQKPDFNNALFTDGAAWLSQLPKGPLLHEWYDKLELNQLNLATEIKGSHPDDFSASQHEFCFRQTWDELGDKIQEAVLKQHPEQAGEDDALDAWIFICPGELKALSLISSGMRATSFTHGEKTIPTVEELRCFRGRRVVLFYDDDPPKRLKTGEIQVVGKTWARKLIPRLYAANALEVRVITGGQK